MALAHSARVRKRYVNVVTEVDVEIDEEALEEAGWHSEDGCPNKPKIKRGLEPAATSDAIASLHRQAHPTEHPDPFLCRDEPCRSLPPEALVAAMGRT